jgi:subtilase family serine protease
MVWGHRKAPKPARGWLLVGASSLLVACAALSASALATGRPPQRVRIGEPVRIHAARDVGVLAAGIRMHVTVALKVRDPVSLAAYAQAVSTPGSSSYHRYLTPTQFAARFGPTSGQVAAVRRSLLAHGLRPGSASVNRLSIPVTGSVAQVEHAFSLSFRRLALRGGRRAVIASAAPAFDAGVARDVQAVLGLSSISPPRPLMVRPQTLGIAVGAHPAAHPVAHASQGAPAPCGQASAAAAPQHAYTADQIAAAYHFSDLYGSGAQGQGQTIAIYELESNDPNDIAAYESCYGINAPVSYIQVDGGAGSGPGSGEAALDIEQAVGLAPKASFLIYQGPNSGQDTPGSGPYDTFNTIISQDRAHVISVSWGECEQLQGSNALSAESALFEEAATQGQSIVSATGDEGSEDCNQANGGAPDPELAVDDPASQPFVTGVGGTTLSSLGPPPSESVWNSLGNPSGPLVLQGGAGGGGVSRAWKMPGYQLAAAGSVHVIGPNSAGSPCAAGNGYCRQVPDVAADADPSTGYIVYWNGSGRGPGPQGWQAVGGTSAAAPLWAALLTDANSSAACQGSPIGFANPGLYQAAATAYSATFNDVTTGNNDLTRTNGGLYPAGPGYDMASGLGSPNAAGLAVVLCANALRVNNPGTQVTTVGQATSLSVTTTAPRGSGLTYYATQLPPGLSISKTAGRITGRPKRIGTWIVGVAALDQKLALRATFFMWRVVGAPIVSELTLSGVAAGRPRLSLTVASGRAAAALKTISIRVPRGLSFASAARAVTVTAAGGRRVGFASRIVRSQLQITLTIPAPKVRIVASYAALRATSGLAATVRQNRTAPLTVAVQTTDAADHPSGTSARIRPRT